MAALVLFVNEKITTYFSKLIVMKYNLQWKLYNLIIFKKILTTTMHTHTHYPSDVVQTLFFNTSPQCSHHYYFLLIIVLLYRSKPVFVREHHGVSGEVDTKLFCHLFLALSGSLLPSDCSPRAILISLSSPTL